MKKSSLKDKGSVRDKGSVAIPCLNIIIAGVGGQGVVLLSKVIMHYFLQQGYDAKRSEVHGMSQRGGSVVVDIRIGKTVYSPTIALGSAHFLVAVDEKEGAYILEKHKSVGCHLCLNDQEKGRLVYPQSKNIALLAKFFSNLSQKPIVVGGEKFSGDYEKAKLSLKQTLSPALLPTNLKVFEDYFLLSN